MNPPNSKPWTPFLFKPELLKPESSEGISSLDLKKWPSEEQKQRLAGLDLTALANEAIAAIVCCAEHGESAPVEAPSCSRHVSGRLAASACAWPEFLSARSLSLPRRPNHRSR